MYSNSRGFTTWFIRQIVLLTAVSYLWANGEYAYGQNRKINNQSVDSQQKAGVQYSTIARPRIVAHYMSWYQRPEVSGSWGFWQVNRPTIPKQYWHYPDKRKHQGRRDISSVYYPVIGPYDSADPDLCEYHILLAKLAGIDAFVADWYGPEPSSEHPYDNIGFTAMRKAAEKLDFKVMICWEDRSMFPAISPNVSTRQEAIGRGVEMLRYLEKQWFSSPAYLKIDNRPVLTNFAWREPGKTIQEPWLSSVEWNIILNSIKVRPVFIHDWHRHRCVNEFEGYESVMPWGCAYHGDVDTAPAFWKKSKQAMLQNKGFLFLSGTVLPGFDNRGCGGWGTDGAIGITSRRDGDKFRATWEDVIRHPVKFIQIATWNDLNEGGTIEPVSRGILHHQTPAEGYGYRELETAAEYAGRLKGFKPNKKALRIPAEIYCARKIVKELQSENYPLPGDVSIASISRIIDKARANLLAGRTATAKKLLTDVNDIFPDKIKKQICDSIGCGFDVPELKEESVRPADAIESR